MPSGSGTYFEFFWSDFGEGQRQGQRNINATLTPVAAAAASTADALNVQVGKGFIYFLAPAFASAPP